MCGLVWFPVHDPNAIQLQLLELRSSPSLIIIQNSSRYIQVMSPGHWVFSCECVTRAHTHATHANTIQLQFPPKKKRRFVSSNPDPKDQLFAQNESERTTITETALHKNVTQNYYYEWKRKIFIIVYEILCHIHHIVPTHTHREREQDKRCDSFWSESNGNLYMLSHLDEWNIKLM